MNNILFTFIISGLFGLSCFIPMEKIEDNLHKAKETNVSTFFYRRMKNYHSPDNEKVLGTRWELLLTDEGYVYYGQRTSNEGKLGINALYKVNKYDLERDLPGYKICEEYIVSNIVVDYLCSIESGLKTIRKMNYLLGRDNIIVTVKYVTLFGERRKEELYLDKQTLSIVNGSSDLHLN